MTRKSAETIGPSRAAELAASLNSSGRPFSEDRLAALGHLSRSLFADTAFGALPEVRAFAYSVRPSELVRLKREFDLLDRPDARLTPRGLVVHFAPANVDSVGSYSWLWAFLLGNANIVRVSERRSTVARELEGRILEALSDQPDLAAQNHWVSYPHDASITAALSDFAGARMIWGGDRAVREITAIRPTLGAVDLVFRNRVSIAVISAGALANLDEKQLADVAARFAADLVTFDQAACSSPRAVFFVGTDAHESAQRWWAAVAGELARRAYDPPEGSAMRKLSASAIGAIRGQIRAVRTISSALTVAEAASPGKVPDYECGWGFVEERFVNELAGVVGSLDDTVQTVTTYGFNSTELDEFARAAGALGVDRIVPVGRALEFGRYWDGYDLMQALTRRVQLVTEGQ